jgi:superfamily I DNA/RNA helicase
MEVYARAVARFGSELSILQDCEPAELARFLPVLGEAVSRMRRGEVLREGGYDGAYGRISVFSEQERREIRRGAGFSGRGGRAAVQGLSLPDIPAEPERSPKHPPAVAPATVPADPPADPPDEEAARPSGSPVPAEAPSSSPAGRPLNSVQEQAILAGPHPVLVLAGPGSGKTRTLVARAGYLLSQGVSPRSILAVTFTRRAASELDERLGDLLGGNSTLPRSDTLHALALEVRHRLHENLPLLLSEENARQVFAEANAGLAPQILRERWSALALARESLTPLSPDLEETASRYSAHKGAWNLADYTDLLEFWLEHRRNAPLNLPWTQVLVDEIQDLSLLQLTLIRSLLPPSGEGFFGIGDPDQSIYGFRGAHSQGPAFFSSSWPSLAVIHLDRNYRSRPGVLAAAASVLGPRAVTRSPDPARNEQASIFLFEARGADSEAAWMAQRIADLLGRGSHTLMDAASQELKQEYAVEGADYTPGDIAILVRVHALAPPLRAALARAGLPVAEPVGDAFWADPRVRLLLQEAGRMLGIALTGSGEAEGLPAFPKHILTKGPLGLAAYFSNFHPFDALFWRSSAFKALVKSYAANGGWPELITWISLQNERELASSKAEKIQILSLHAAKGLEFAVVFLPCLEDGLLPFAGELLSGKGEKHSPADTDEERRLFYVGLTRAKDALFLSHAGRRVLYGHELRLKPSRFLAALPAQGPGAPNRSRLVARIEHKEKQLTLWGEK